VTVLIVGGDDVDAIREEMALQGLVRASHWDGPKARNVKRSLPRDTRVVLIMIGYVNRNLMHKLKQTARRGGTPVIYANCSLADASKNRPARVTRSRWRREAAAPAWVAAPWQPAC
jgi:hypothetical protein